MASENFQWGLVGYGDLARKRLAGALQQAEGSTLTGIWGRDKAQAQTLADKNDVPVVYDDYDQMIGSDIDAVYVATPADTHFEYAARAIEKGKHVVIEKPMASNTQECLDLVELAKKHNVKLGVAYYLRFYPKMQRVKQLIDEGVLGKITWVNITCHGWYNPSPDDPKYWRVQKARSAGGGAVADIGVHRFDLLDYWLGESSVIWSGEQRLAHDYEVEDGSSAVLALPGGAYVHTYFAWNTKSSSDRFEITGTEGKILIDSLLSPHFSLIRNGEREEFEVPPVDNAYINLAEDFIESVRSDRQPLSSGESGMRSNRLLERVLDWG
jgi:1,5-anhydro-D-fructose reductase (1,5-anhydro-D-mannitol-forming)